MPKQALPAYQCPRCGYETPRKPCMRDHFNKKKPCPGIKEIMELTDTIKDHVLTHRVYQKPDAKKNNVINNIINNYNQYNNIQNTIAGMDAVEKLEHYLAFKNKELIDLDTAVDEKFRGRALKYDKDEYDKHITNKEFLDIVAEPLNYYHVDDDERHAFHNVIYDTKHKELKIYDGSWECMGLDDGACRYIEVIKQRFLDSYERYLLRTIKTTREGQDKARFREMLESYFAFIACFHLEPFCIDATDDEILRPVSSDDDDEEDDSDSDEDSDDDNKVRSHPYHKKYRPPSRQIEEEYYPVYNAIAKGLKKAFITKTIRDVHDTIKRNSAKNVGELNKKITKLFHMEETFRDVLLSIQQG